MILESLDIMISLGVIFLVLSMVQKYIMSLLKRFLRTKAGVASKEMKVFIGENTSKYLELYCKKVSKHLNLFEKNDISGTSKGFRVLSPDELKEVAKELRTYLEGKDKAKLQQDLGEEKITDDMIAKLPLVKAHLDALQIKAETVYNNTLRKIRESYTSRLRWWTFFSSLVVVIIINASFFDIYNSIATNNIVRDKLVYNADQFMERLEKVESDIVALNISEVESIQNDIEDVKDKIHSITGSLPAKHGFFGWSKGEFTEMRQSVRRIINKFCGFVISAFLISFGAPFWHDYLKTFVNIRKVVAQKTDKNENGDSTSPASAKGSGS